MSEIYMTKETIDKLKEELLYLKGTKRREISKAIGTAREQGDLKENAEYHAAREEQGFVEARIKVLEDKLSRATVLDKEALPDDTVCIGVKVTLRDVDKGTEIAYTLVDTVEANFAERKIATTTPIAQGLMGKKVGDIAEIRVPIGIIKYEIISIVRE
ncbi:transcription elongation factor GreA [Candidatus Desantisbacteria bacterium]|nr:transcription elongation factor GreA [Candidatus Desantisbacteria bacterium]